MPYKTPPHHHFFCISKPYIKIRGLIAFLNRSRTLRFLEGVRPTFYVRKAVQKRERNCLFLVVGAWWIWIRFKSSGNSDVLNSAACKSTGPPGVGLHGLNLDYIHLTNLPAVWPWEILKSSCVPLHKVHVKKNVCKPLNMSLVGNSYAIFKFCGPQFPHL